jgi:two-component system chemotaxis sensor kinase CheA
MPLITISNDFQRKTEGRQQVVVFTEGDRSMGLMVDEILDIVEDRLDLELASTQDGLLGTAVIDGKATEVIDLTHYLGDAFGDWFNTNQRNSDGTSAKGKRILLVDDSPFFRNLLTPLLNVAGYSVTAVDGPEKALALREEGYDFDVIISDIEMPGMDGFEFASTVRDSGSWSDVPLLALSSHADKESLDRGREVGFTDYIAKLDRDALLESLSETLSNLRGAA